MSKNMKIICSQESLLHGIQIVQKGISSRIGLPIYNGILFEANEDNKVHLFATDLEIGIDCYIPAQVIETGSTVIPSKIISELIKKFPEGKIEIECTENNITTITENNSNYKILGFSAEEFSNFPEIKMIAKIKLNQKLFKETIQQVIFSTSRDESKTFLNGALFKIIDNKIEVVTTDSHRLSLKNIQPINIEEFRDKMERIALFVREDLKTVKMEITNKENNQKQEKCEIFLKAESPSTGEAFEKILSFKKGEDINITFNTDYILDILKTIKKENTIIKLNDPLNPAIITPDEDKSYIYILMPVRAE